MYLHLGAIMLKEYDWLTNRLFLIFVINSRKFMIIIFL